MARSPSYPQVSLPKAIELVREVYAGAHKSAIDSETVIELLGYSSRSGRALAVVGALKQFGLLEGREDNIRVTSLALSILEPLTEKERTDSLRQAAFQPDLFSELLREFGESAPSEAVIRSIAIRKFGFTNAGADNVSKSYLETIRYLKNATGSEDNDEIEPEESEPPLDGIGGASVETKAVPQASIVQTATAANVLQFPISKDTTVRVEFFGEINRDAISRLIKHLELAADIYED